MKTFLINNLTIGFGSYKFKGLKLKWSYEDYPFKNKKDASDFTNKFISTHNESDKICWKNLSHKSYKDDMHIALSRGFVAEQSSFILLFLSILMFMGHLNVITILSVTFLSIFCMLTHLYFIKIVKLLEKSIIQNDIWIDFLVDLEKEN